MHNPTPARLSDPAAITVFPDEVFRAQETWALSVFRNLIYNFGTSYRSAIFYTSDEQRRIAEDTIADVDASGLWPGKAVTEVVPAGDFWEAEPEHQDYLRRYPDGSTCHFVRPHRRLPIRTDKVATQA